jgi:hypothetical protein
MAITRTLAAALAGLAASTIFTATAATSLAVLNASPAQAEVVAPVICHTVRCETHRTEERLHIPHHTDRGFRW